MGELGAFLRIERSGPKYRDPKERVGDFQEFVENRPVPELLTSTSVVKSSVTVIPGRSTRVPVIVPLACSPPANTA